MDKIQARAAREFFVKQLEGIEAVGPESPFLPLYVSYAREIIKALDNGDFSDIIQALAGTFGMSTTDVARLLTDPDETVQQVVDAVPTSDNYVSTEQLLAVVGEETLVGQYLQMTSELESPPLYHLGSLLTVASACLPRKPIIDFGFYVVYPNLYTLIVGDSGVKKSSAASMAIRLFRSAVPGLVVLPREASPQSYAGALNHVYETTGISRGLIFAPEARVVFGRQKYKEDFAVWLTEWFDCEDYWDRRLQSIGHIELHKLYVSLLACTNQEWLRRVPEDVVKGGFMPRTWVLYSPRKSGWRWRPKQPGEALERIRRGLRLCFADLPARITLSSEADRFMQRWYENDLPRRQRDAHHVMKEYYERAHILALKIAMLLCLLDRQTVIDTAHVSRAVDLLDLTEPGTETVLRGVTISSEGEIVDDIVKLLRRSGGRAAENEIVRRLQLKYAPTRIRQTLAALTANETLKSVLVSGRKMLLLSEQMIDG